MEDNDLKQKEKPRQYSTTHNYSYGLSAATPVPSILSLRFVLNSVNKSVKICTLFSKYQRGHRPNGNSPLNQRSEPNLCGRKKHLVHCSSLLVTKIISDLALPVVPLLNSIYQFLNFPVKVKMIVTDKIAVENGIDFSFVCRKIETYKQQMFLQIKIQDNSVHH